MIIENITNCYKVGEKVIKFCNDLFKVTHKAAYDSKHGILILKQIYQRLLIVLTQVKTGNRFESLLHEIRLIIYSLYRE